jgi:hypothetical protein
VDQGEKNRQGAWELIEDLKSKYKDVAGHFEQFLSEAEEAKQLLEHDLADL